MNKVMLMGRLTRDPEARYGGGDKSAEFAEKYLRQGTKIAITGRIQTGSYTNRDGQKIYTTDVVVEDQEFAESKASADSGNYQGATQRENGNRQAAPVTDASGFITHADEKTHGFNRVDDSPQIF